MKENKIFFTRNVIKSCCKIVECGESNQWQSGWGGGGEDERKRYEARIAMIEMSHVMKRKAGEEGGEKRVQIPFIKCFSNCSNILAC